MTKILKRVGIFLFILVCVFFNNVYAEKINLIDLDMFIVKHLKSMEEVVGD